MYETASTRRALEQFQLLEGALVVDCPTVQRLMPVDGPELTSSTLCTMHSHCRKLLSYC